jgi:flagellar hook protein FlgE
MSITKTLYTGVAGLSAHGTALGVVGDNIANINTTGYKAERTVFADLLGRSMMMMDQPGSGVKLLKIRRSFSQGTLLTTDSPTDLAINGKGFFIVAGQMGGQDANFYTRAGQFTLDKDGNMVNPQGFVVQGYLANADGTIDNQLTDLTIANSVLPPSKTTIVEISTNLDATSPTFSGAGWDPTDPPANPGSESNFSTAITVFDSLGNAHRVDIYFRKIQDADAVTGTNAQWEYHALVPSSELSAELPGFDPSDPATNPLYEVSNGVLEFNSEGWLEDDTLAVATTARVWDDTTPPFAGAERQALLDETGALVSAVEFDFGLDIVNDASTGQAGSTSYASSSSIRSQEQNGYSTGELAGVGIQSNGEVMAVYSNGEQRLVAQMAIATFEAEEELARAGDSLWAVTQASGDARIGAAATGSAGAITSGALEQSTVDLAGEFVNLISYQRGFQANSRTVSTADQLYQEVVNLKR